MSQPFVPQQTGSTQNYVPQSPWGAVDSAAAHAPNAGPWQINSAQYPTADPFAGPTPSTTARATRSRRLRVVAIAAALTATALIGYFAGQSQSDSSTTTQAGTDITAEATVAHAAQPGSPTAASSAPAGSQLDYQLQSWETMDKVSSWFAAAGRPRVTDESDRLATRFNQFAELVYVHVDIHYLDGLVEGEDSPLYPRGVSQDLVPRLDVGGTWRQAAPDAAVRYFHTRVYLPGDTIYTAEMRWVKFRFYTSPITGHGYWLASLENPPA